MRRSKRGENLEVAGWWEFIIPRSNKNPAITATTNSKCLLPEINNKAQIRFQGSKFVLQ